MNWLLPGSPKKIHYDNIHSELLSLEGVKAVHSLKIWTLTSNEVNASVHLAVGECCFYTSVIQVDTYNVEQLN